MALRSFRFDFRRGPSWTDCGWVKAIDLVPEHHREMIRGSKGPRILNEFLKRLGYIHRFSVPKLEITGILDRLSECDEVFETFTTFAMEEDSTLFCFKSEAEAIRMRLFI